MFISKVLCHSIGDVLIVEEVIGHDIVVVVDAFPGILDIIEEIVLVVTL